MHDLVQRLSSGRHGCRSQSPTRGDARGLQSSRGLGRSLWGIHRLDPAGRAASRDVAQHPTNGNCYVPKGRSCFEWVRAGADAHHPASLSPVVLPESELRQ